MTNLRYRESLKFLLDTVGDGIISQKAIENLYQRAILTALDIQERRKYKPFAHRLEAALEELRKSLTVSPASFNVYYPVYGLASDGLPIKVGNVMFCTFDDKHLEQFVKLLSEYEGTEDEKSKRIDFIDIIKQSEIIGKPVSLIEMKAIDVEAAKISALKELALTLDIINFLAILFHTKKVISFSLVTTSDLK